MQTKKPSGLLSPSGLVKLVSQAMMGVAMGLGFALLLILINPSGIATLINQGGDQAIRGFVGTVVLTFAIGATLTGVAFMMMEDN
jgi:RsiW-degrading membrane proteinase PrsW (M82 family)